MCAALQDKDFFLRKYEKLTSWRLLNETSVSREAEEQMVEKIEISQGIEQVIRLKQMFSDIDLSEIFLKEMQQE